MKLFQCYQRTWERTRRSAKKNALGQQLWHTQWPKKNQNVATGKLLSILESNVVSRHSMSQESIGGKLCMIVSLYVPVQRLPILWDAFGITQVAYNLSIPVGLGKFPKLLMPAPITSVLGDLEPVMIVCQALPGQCSTFPCKGLPLGSVVGCTPYHAWLHDHVMRLKKAGSVLLVIRSSGIANSKNLLHLTERGFQRTMFKNIANMFSLPNLVVTLALSP